MLVKCDASDESKNESREEVAQRWMTIKEVGEEISITMLLQTRYPQSAVS